jgi:hypothetical protein
MNTGSGSVHQPISSGIQPGISGLTAHNLISLHWVTTIWLCTLIRIYLDIHWYKMKRNSNGRHGIIPNFAGRDLLPVTHKTDVTIYYISLPVEWTLWYPVVRTTTECTTGLQNVHMRTFLALFKWNVRNKLHVSSKTVTRKHGLFANISLFLHDWYYLAVPLVTFLPVFLFPETSDYATRGFSETQNWSKFFTSFQVAHTLSWESFREIFLFPTSCMSAWTYQQVTNEFFQIFNLSS